MKTTLVAGLLTFGLAGCMPEDGSPSRAFPVSAEMLPFMQAYGYEQTTDSGRIFLSKNGIELWRSQLNCTRYCINSYVGPSGLEPEIKAQFRENYLAAREDMLAHTRATLGLTAP